MSDDLTWPHNTISLTKKAQKQGHFFFNACAPTYPPQFTEVIESVLASLLNVWYGNYSALDCKTLQRVVKTVENILRVSLPLIQVIYPK